MSCPHEHPTRKLDNQDYRQPKREVPRHRGGRSRSRSRAPAPRPRSQSRPREVPQKHAAGTPRQPKYAPVPSNWSERPKVGWYIKFLHDEWDRMPEEMRKRGPEFRQAGLNFGGEKWRQKEQFLEFMKGMTVGLYDQFGASFVETCFRTCYEEAKAHELIVQTAAMSIQEQK